ncbi:MAG: N-acetyl-gamma-glutamyl-phosphate reductase [Desulfovibrionaceae bacterium]|nr:N-acetyl-gamma-glutamyl-phosphate reductase [Desulfovibrionaceae bacterium]
MSEIIRAGLVGVTGYTGMELARILAAHPVIRLTAVTSREEAGRALEDIYPFLRGFACGKLCLIAPDPEALAKSCDLAFLAVPHGAAMELAATLRALGVKVVDLSADFRLREAGIYREWYGQEHTQPARLKEAVYGLPELYAGEIAGAGLVANPGCYPTSVILALYPLLRQGLVETGSVIIDAKSGVSGAGRKASQAHLFSEVGESFRPYSVPRHRHTPEIEQELSLVAGREVLVTFTPHLLPVNRGILSSIYLRPTAGAEEESLRAAFAGAYAGSRFVRLLPPGSLPELRYVRGSMYCDIGLVMDKRSGRLMVFSAIDNLCRGASGQAVANANLMSGLPLECGLEAAPLAP